MSDTDGKAGEGRFKKRAHRPWKSSLLETTVKEFDDSAASEETFSFDITSDLELSEGSNPFETAFNFIDEDLATVDLSPSLSNKFSQLQAISIADDLGPLDLPVSGPNQELKYAIKETQQQQNTLKKQISDKSTNSILLGGFFQPQQLASQSESYNGRKINYLITDLKHKEQELSSLTSNLKITEAIERAEQSELNRRAEEHARLAAEKRMRQAIDQAQQTADQIRQALEQANQASVAQREEERLRKLAEEQIKDSKMRAASAELALHNERTSRTQAETEYTEQLNRLESAKKNEEIRRQEVEQQIDTLQRELHKKETEYKDSFNKIVSLENTVKDLTSKQMHTEQKLAELTAQREKLKSIISAEQDLRKAAEKRAADATEKADQAEKARFAEEQQRKMIDERAKRAVEHASRTVMHLLNSPGNNEYAMHIPNEAAMPNMPKQMPQEKVRIRAEPVISRTAEIEDDDYSF